MRQHRGCENEGTRGTAECEVDEIVRGGDLFGRERGSLRLVRFPCCLKGDRQMGERSGPESLFAQLLELVHRLPKLLDRGLRVSCEQCDRARCMRVRAVHEPIAHLREQLRRLGTKLAAVLESPLQPERKTLHL